MPWQSDGPVYDVDESLSGSGSDVPFTSTSPGEAFTDSSLDGDPIRVHKRLGGPPWLQDALSVWPRGSFRATAVDLHNLQITGQRLLQVTADPPSERAPVQVKAEEPLRSLQESFPPSGPRTAAPISPWLRHHPILGAVLQGEPPQARPLLPDAASRPLSPRGSNWTGLTSTPRVDPSPRQSEARLQETPPEGLREVDREILEQLRALSEAVKAISTTSTQGSTAEKQQTVEQLDAKRAAEAKKRLLSASCMALGVKDDRLMLVDCFLSWSHAWQSSKDTTSTRDVAAQAEDRSSASHLPEEAPAEDPSGPVLPVLADHALRALLGEEVWLDPDGSLHGASLWLSMTPPQASRRFLQTFDICLPEVPSVPSAASAPLQEVSIQTSPRQGQLVSGSSQEASPKVTPKHQRGADDVTPERVLQRISGLMTEMTAMETSLENLREQMEKEEAQHLDLEPLLELEEEDEGCKPLAAPKQEPRSRLRSRLPASLSWLEEAARKGRPSIPMQSCSQAPKRAPRNPRRPGLRSSAH